MNKNAETIICTWTGRRLPSAAANVTKRSAASIIFGDYFELCRTRRTLNEMSLRARDQERG